MNSYICSCYKQFSNFLMLRNHLRINHNHFNSYKVPIIIPRSIQIKKFRNHQMQLQYLSQPLKQRNHNQSVQSLDHMIYFLNSIENKQLNYSLQNIIKQLNWTYRHDANLFILNQSQSQDNNPTLSYQIIFSKCISMLSGAIHQQILKEIIELFVIWKKYVKNLKSKDYEYQQINQQIINDAFILVYTANQFIHQYFSKYSTQSHNHNGLLTGQNKQYHLNKFIYYFSKWMYASNYTDAVLAFDCN